MRLEDMIKRKGLELGFTHVGIAPVRDHTEYEQEVLGREDYSIFANGDDSLLMRAARTKTLHPEARSVVCATLGFSDVAFPENMSKSVARTYLSRTYTPPTGFRFAAIIDAFADYLEELGLEPDRNQFNVPQRLACAEAGIITYGCNNFAYTPEDGSFIILVTFLVNKELEVDEPTVRCDCPPDCHRCMEACPIGAIIAPYRLQLDRCMLFNNQRFEPGAQEEIWDEMGLRIHGCDACQLACPRNHEVLNAPKKKDAFLELLKDEFDLERILLLDDEYYEAVVYPIMYNYIRNKDIFRWNAAVALGNTDDASHIPALQSALENAEEPHLIKAINWAISKLEEQNA